MKAIIGTIEIGKPTKNGRIYTKEVVEKIVDLYNKKINSDSGCYVTIESPDYNIDNIDLSKVAGVVKSCSIEDNHIVIDIEPLSSNNGILLKKLMEFKVIDFTPNLVGSLGEKLKKEFTFIPDLIGNSNLDGYLVNVDDVISFSTVPLY
jgi:hypothetical protein